MSLSLKLGKCLKQSLRLRVANKGLILLFSTMTNYWNKLTLKDHELLNFKQTELVANLKFELLKRLTHRPYG